MSEIELVGLKWFTSGNDYTGSVGPFNYIIVPEEGLLKAAVWHGEACSEKSEMTARREFPLSAEGLEETRTWLREQHEDYLQSC